MKYVGVVGVRPQQTQDAQARLGTSNLSVCDVNASEAGAGEVEGDQTANAYCSRSHHCKRRSTRIVWSVLLPVGQHVRDHLTVPEHVWKTGDPWFSAKCSRVSSMSGNRDATGRDHAEVRPARLTAIMEGIPKPLHPDPRTRHFYFAESPTFLLCVDTNLGSILGMAASGWTWRASEPGTTDDGGG